MRFVRPHEPLVLEERDNPALHEGEVLVRLRASGVCGSDVHIWKGEDPLTPSRRASARAASRAISKGDGFKRRRTKK